jgi:predicted flap endonuclease-1-like 5' DNA nuclease
MSAIDDLLDVLLDLAEPKEPVEGGVEPAVPEEVEEQLMPVLDLVEFLFFGGPVEEIGPEQIAQHLERQKPGDEILGAVFNTFEESLLASLKNKEELTPGNVEQPLSDLEGTAAGIAIGANLLVALIESIPGEDIDAGTQAIAQVLSFQGAQELIGREVDATLQEGVDPALKQKVHIAHRSKQADFQDYVDAQRTVKATGQRIPPRTGEIPQEIRDLFHPDDLSYVEDPTTYGTIPDQDDLFSLAGLQVGEPEEIIEEPIQYGLPVPKRPVEAVNAVSGAPEDVKSIYRQVIEELPKSENLIQDYVRLTEFNFRLREKVQAGAFSAETAVRVIEPELRDLIDNALPEDRYRPEDRTADETVTELVEELGRNFALLESIPDDPPTFSDIERAYREGIISRRRYRQLYDEYGPQPFFIEEKIRVQDIRTGADDIARQEALGRLTTTQARNKLKSIGFSPDQIAEILAGADPDELIAQAQQRRSTVSQVPLSAISGIGENRALSLNVAGIESIADLANASVEEVATNARVGNDQAARFIQIAQGVLERAA